MSLTAEEVMELPEAESWHYHQITMFVVFDRYGRAWRRVMVEGKECRQEVHLP